MARILFITSNRIGDAVLSTVALEQALALAPGASVVVACGPLAAPLFRAIPNLDRIELLGKERGRWMRLWRSVRGEAFDVSVDLRGSITTLFLRSKRRFIHRKARDIRHKVDELAGLVEGPRLLPRIRVDAKAEADASAMLGEEQSFLALGPGSNFVGKRWPAESFGALAVHLCGAGGRLSGLSVLLLGGPEDDGVCAGLAAELAGKGVAAINAAGRLDLLACAAALKRARLFVGNDSGLMHIAAAIGAPTIGLFGPSDERIYGPFGAHTRAVRGPRSFEEILTVGNMPDITYSLMTDLTVDRVEAAAIDLLEQTRP